MNQIQILPNEIANQIAAGEVVERPASIVKELLENALDAGATAIEIKIENGGKDLIEITDNGSGMSAEDAEKSILRHATSKISNIDDLFSIQSFGFRGEALAAISSVSNLQIFTKTAQQNSGTLVQISAGKNKKVQPTAANTGTKIVIKDLFFSTPARLKYLKNASTEFNHCYRQIQSFALAYPSVRFSIHKDGKLYKDFLPADLQIRSEKILNLKPNQVLPVSHIQNGIKISGFVVIPGECKSHKKNQFLFVNNRLIDDYKLSYAAREAYVQSAGIEKHLHPVFVLFLELDPILVDVNVHPRKLEVKFSEPRDVFSVTKNGVMKSLETMVRQQFEFPSVTNFMAQKSKTSGFSNNPTAPISFPNPSFGSRNASRNTPSQSDWQSFSTEKITESSSVDPIENLTELRLVGQIANKYILAEAEYGMYFFDQHALHERQRFETFWNEFQAQKEQQNFVSQTLIIPQTATLQMQSVTEIFKPKNLQSLEKLGFQLKLVSDENLEILAVPQLLEGENFETVLEDFAQYFADGKVGENAIEQLMRKKLEYKSCRGSIMFGDKLEPVEMQKLLDDFLTTKWRNLCPHGRPNHWFVPFDELDEKFHR